MAWGTVTAGGISFREEITVEENGDGQLVVRGQESFPPQTLDAVRKAHRNVLGLRGEAAVPVVFTDKVALTGYYQVDEARSVLTDWANGAVVVATWQLTLLRVGTGRDLEFESRVPTIARTTELVGQTPSFWHAPPAGTRDYFTGPAGAGATTARASADGELTVYRGLPANVAPRWTVAAPDYMRGAARLLFGGIRHAGLDTPADAAWELSNALVRVQPDGAGFTVAAWSGNAWRSAKGYRVTVNGAAVAAVPEATVLRNDPEEAVLRLTYPTAAGRLTADLGLRRGSRFVTVIAKRHAAATLGLARSTAEPATAVTGGLRATSADADGNRFVMGSSRTLNTAADPAAISKTGVVQLDAFLGHEIGAAPVAGDAFADLLAQYLGTTGETVRAVRR